MNSKVAVERKGGEGNLFGSGKTIVDALIKGMVLGPLVLCSVVSFFVFGFFFFSFASPC